MISWIVFIFGLAASWHYTDLQSESLFQSTISPILVGIFLVLLLIKFVFLVGSDSGRGGQGGDGGGFFGGFGGGDGGCGGGDGGGC